MVAIAASARVEAVRAEGTEEAAKVGAATEEAMAVVATEEARVGGGARGVAFADAREVWLDVVGGVSRAPYVVAHDRWCRRRAPRSRGGRLWWRR